MCVNHDGGEVEGVRCVGTGSRLAGRGPRLLPSPFTGEGTKPKVV